jgi:hypothetical protein
VSARCGATAPGSVGAESKFFNGHELTPENVVLAERGRGGVAVCAELSALQHGAVNTAQQRHL